MEELERREKALLMQEKELALKRAELGFKDEKKTHVANRRRTWNQLFADERACKLNEDKLALDNDKGTHDIKRAKKELDNDERVWELSREKIAQENSKEAFEHEKAKKFFDGDMRMHELGVEDQELATKRARHDFNKARAEETFAKMDRQRKLRDKQMEQNRAAQAARHEGVTQEVQRLAEATTAQLSSVTADHAAILASLLPQSLVPAQLKPLGDIKDCAGMIETWSGDLSASNMLTICSGGRALKGILLDPNQWRNERRAPMVKAPEDLVATELDSAQSWEMKEESESSSTTTVSDMRSFGYTYAKETHEESSGFLGIGASSKHESSSFGMETKSSKQSASSSNVSSAHCISVSSVDRYQILLPDHRQLRLSPQAVAWLREGWTLLRRSGVAQRLREARMARAQEAASWKRSSQGGSVSILALLTAGDSKYPIRDGTSCRARLSQIFKLMFEELGSHILTGPFKLGGVFVAIGSAVATQKQSATALSSAASMVATNSTSDGKSSSPDQIAGLCADAAHAGLAAAGSAKGAGKGIEAAKSFVPVVTNLVSGLIPTVQHSSGEASKVSASSGSTSYDFWSEKGIHTKTRRDWSGGIPTDDCATWKATLFKSDRRLALTDRGTKLVALWDIVRVAHLDLGDPIELVLNDVELQSLFEVLDRDDCAGLWRLTEDLHNHMKQHSLLSQEPRDHDPYGQVWRYLKRGALVIAGSLVPAGEHHKLKVMEDDLVCPAAELATFMEAEFLAIHQDAQKCRCNLCGGYFLPGLEGQHAKCREPFRKANEELICRHVVNGCYELRQDDPNDDSTRGFYTSLRVPCPEPGCGKLVPASLLDQHSRHVCYGRFLQRSGLPPDTPRALGLHIRDAVPPSGFIFPPARSIFNRRQWLQEKGKEAAAAPQAEVKASGQFHETAHGILESFRGLLGKVQHFASPREEHLLVQCEVSCQLSSWCPGTKRFEGTVRWLSKSRACTLETRSDDDQCLAFTVDGRTAELRLHVESQCFRGSWPLTVQFQSSVPDHVRMWLAPLQLGEASSQGDQSELIRAFIPFPKKLAPAHEHHLRTGHIYARSLRTGVCDFRRESQKQKLLEVAAQGDVEVLARQFCSPGSHWVALGNFFKVQLLRMACGRGHQEVVSYLVEQLQDRPGSRGLCAVLQEHWLQEGDEVQVTDSSMLSERTKCILGSMLDGNAELVVSDIVLDDDGDLVAVHPKGSSPCSAVHMEGDMVAPRRSVFSDGPLHLAIRSCHFAMAKYLVKVLGNAEGCREQMAEWIRSSVLLLVKVLFGRKLDAEKEGLCVEVLELCLQVLTSEDDELQDHQSPFDHPRFGNHKFEIKSMMTSLSNESAAQRARRMQELLEMGTASARENELLKGQVTLLGEWRLPHGHGPWRTASGVRGIPSIKLRRGGTQTIHDVLREDRLGLFAKFCDDFEARSREFEQRLLAPAGAASSLGAAPSGAPPLATLGSPPGTRAASSGEGVDLPAQRLPHALTPAGEEERRLLRSAKLLLTIAAGCPALGLLAGLPCMGMASAALPTSYLALRWRHRSKHVYPYLVDRMIKAPVANLVEAVRGVPPPTLLSYGVLRGSDGDFEEFKGTLMDAMNRRDGRARYDTLGRFLSGADGGQAICQRSERVLQELLDQSGGTGLAALAGRLTEVQSHVRALERSAELVSTGHMHGDEGIRDNVMDVLQAQVVFVVERTMSAVRDCVDQTLKTLGGIAPASGTATLDQLWAQSKEAWHAVQGLEERIAELSGQPSRVGELCARIGRPTAQGTVSRDAAQSLQEQIRTGLFGPLEEACRRLLQSWEDLRELHKTYVTNLPGFWSEWAKLTPRFVLSQSPELRNLLEDRLPRVREALAKTYEEQDKALFGDLLQSAFDHHLAGQLVLTDGLVQDVMKVHDTLDAFRAALCDPQAGDQGRVVARLEVQLARRTAQPEAREREPMYQLMRELLRQGGRRAAPLPPVNGHPRAQQLLDLFRGKQQELDGKMKSVIEDSAGQVSVAWERAAEHRASEEQVKVNSRQLSNRVFDLGSAFAVARSSDAASKAWLIELLSSKPLDELDGLFIRIHELTGQQLLQGALGDRERRVIEEVTNRIRLMEFLRLDLEVKIHRAQDLCSDGLIVFLGKEQDALIARTITEHKVNRGAFAHALDAKDCCRVVSQSEKFSAYRLAKFQAETSWCTSNFAAELSQRCRLPRQPARLDGHTKTLAVECCEKLMNGRHRQKSLGGACYWDLVEMLRVAVVAAGCSTFEDARKSRGYRDAVARIRASVLEQVRVIRDQWHKPSEHTDTYLKVLAGVLAVWTGLTMVKNEDAGDGMVEFKQPHPTQVLCLFHFLGLIPEAKGVLEKTGAAFTDIGAAFTDILVAREKPACAELENALAQVGTGLGKSVILGTLATVLALLGFRVRCACYSSYLSDRDRADFQPLFEAFKVESHIAYSDMASLARDIIGKTITQGASVHDLPNVVFDRTSVEITAQRSMKEVLVLDEVDIFFQREIYGSSYIPLYRRAIKDGSGNNVFTPVLDLTWERARNGESVGDIIDGLDKCPQWNDMKAKLLERGIFTNLDAEKLFQRVAGKAIEVRDGEYEAHRDYDVVFHNGGAKIGFATETGCGRIFSAQSCRPYADAFVLRKTIEELTAGRYELAEEVRQLDRARVLQDLRVQREVCDSVQGGLGSFSYAEMLREFEYVFGVAGTIMDMPHKTKSILSALPKPLANTLILPSVYQKLDQPFKEGDKVVIRGLVGDPDNNREGTVLTCNAELEQCEIELADKDGVANQGDQTTDGAASPGDRKTVRMARLEQQTFDAKQSLQVSHKLKTQPMVEADTRDEQFRAIVDQINSEAAQQQRSVLVFFKDDGVMSEFAEHVRKIQVGSRSDLDARLLDILGNHVGYVKVNSSARAVTRAIETAMQQPRVTCFCEEHSRGLDFKPQTSLEAKGGVHCVHAFLSSTRAAQIQVMGRTARQGRSGSYALVLCRQDREAWARDRAALSQKEIESLRDARAEKAVGSQQQLVERAAQKHVEARERVRALLDYKAMAGSSQEVREQRAFQAFRQIVLGA